jgi:hypothetical protein
MDQPLFQAFLDKSVQADAFLFGFDDHTGMQGGGKP